VVGCSPLTYGSILYINLRLSLFVAALLRAGVVSWVTRAHASLRPKPPSRHGAALKRAVPLTAHRRRTAAAAAASTAPQCSTPNPMSELHQMLRRARLVLPMPRRALHNQGRADLMHDKQHPCESASLATCERCLWFTNLIQWCMHPSMHGQSQQGGMSLTAACACTQRRGSLKPAQQTMGMHQQWSLPFQTDSRQSLLLDAAALGRPLVAIVPIPFFTRHFRLAAARFLRLAVQESERVLGCAAHCRATSGIVAELLYELLYRLQQQTARCQ
jgi:hypothetical protein